MVLKNDYKNEKIRIAKRRMNRLNKRYYNIIDKLGYLRNIIEDYERLEHREDCPLCNHKISSEYYEKQIPKIKNKIRFLEAWIDQNYSYTKRYRIGRPITELTYIKEKERKAQIEQYIIKNRNKLNKVIRTFELPTDIITNNEKELWNIAIQIQLDKKGMDENDDLEFMLN